MRYAKIIDGIVVEELNTRTEIPQEQWVKKNVLPLEILRVENVEGVNPERADGLYILEDKVEKVVNRFVTPLTLEQVKEQKIEEAKYVIEQELPSVQEQINAVLGLYDEAKNQEIKDLVTAKFSELETKKTGVYSKTSIAEVKAISLKNVVVEDVGTKK